jgi:hypothetical protein
MKKLINTIIADRITRSAAVISWLLVIVAVGYIAVVFPSLPPYIPLYNQLGWGDPRLTERVYIILPPLLCFGIIILNTIIAALVYGEMPLVSRMAAITSLLVSALMLIFVFRVTQLIM